MINKSARQFEKVFFLIYIILIFNEILDLSQLSYSSFFEGMRKGILVASLVFLFAFWIVKTKVKKGEFLFGIVLISLCGIVINQSGKFSQILLVFIVAFFGMGIDKRRICKIYIYTVITAVVIVLMLSLMGIFSTYSVMNMRGVIRYSLGFTGVTYLPNLLFYIAIAYYYYKQDITLKSTMVFTVANAILYYLCLVRAAFYELFVLLILLWVCKKFWRKKVVSGVIKWSSILGMPALAIIAVYLAKNYGKQYVALDYLLTGRLYLANTAYKRYGINLFGHNIEWVGSGGDYFFVDSSYVNILLSFGIIMLVFTIIGFVGIAIRDSKEGNYFCCVVLFLIALHSFSDPQLLDARYDPMIAMLCAGFYNFNLKSLRKTEVRHVIKRKRHFQFLD